MTHKTLGMTGNAAAVCWHESGIASARHGPRSNRRTGRHHYRVVDTMPAGAQCACGRQDLLPREIRGEIG